MEENDRLNYRFFEEYAFMRRGGFRGKRIDNDDWFIGRYIWPLFRHDGDQKTRLICLFDAESNKSFHVYPESICEFTGLVDKTGKKIFEGDIVKTKYGRLYIVVWFSSLEYNGWDLEVVRTSENYNTTRRPDSFDIYKKENLEVVGNVHDNPELLREK